MHQKGTNVLKEPAVPNFRVKENGGGKFLRNVGIFLPNYTAAHFKRQKYLYSPS
jgi:hypothetical protein